MLAARRSPRRRAKSMSFIIWKAVRSDTRCLGAAPAARTALPRSETSGDTCAASLLPFFVFLFFFYFPFFFFFSPTKIYQGRRLPPGGQCISPPFSPTSLLPSKTCTRCQTREAREEPRRRMSRPSILFGLGTVLVGLFLYFFILFFSPPQPGWESGLQKRTPVNKA